MLVQKYVEKLLRKRNNQVPGAVVSGPGMSVDPKIIIESMRILWQIGRGP